MKFHATLITSSLFAAVLATGCLDSADEGSTDVTSDTQAVTGGGSLACTNVDASDLTVRGVTCDPLGHCTLTSTPANGTTTAYPLAVLSARRGIVILQSGAAGIKVVMSVVGSTPKAADLYGAAGTVAHCQ